MAARVVVGVGVRAGFEDGVLALPFSPRDEFSSS